VEEQKWFASSTQPLSAWVSSCETQAALRVSDRSDASLRRYRRPPPRAPSNEALQPTKDRY
jgi:hypothetical protein